MPNTVMRSQQSLMTSPNKNVHFGETCESGYSTTTSSEEGTLQRKTNPASRAHGNPEANLNLKKTMVPKSAASEESRVKKGGNKHKKRSKNNYFARGSSTSPSPSPYSSTSSLTQYPGTNPVNDVQEVRTKKTQQQRQIPNSMRHGLLTSSYDIRALQRQKYVMRNRARSQDNLVQQTSLEEMTSSMEDLGFNGSNAELCDNDVTQQDDVFNSASPMEQIKQSDVIIDKRTIGHVDYYSVGNNQQNRYYDPLDISESQRGQTKKQVLISKSPSSSSETNLKKPSPIRGILKHSKHPSVPQGSAPNTPHHHSLYSNYQLSKSEENLSSIQRMTPPSMPVSPLSPGARKSAFVAVKPRSINRYQIQDSGPVISVNPSVQDIMSSPGFERDLQRQEFNFSGVNMEQALQMQVTPRVTHTNQQMTAPVKYRTIVSQLDDSPEVTSQNQKKSPEKNVQNVNKVGRVSTEGVRNGHNALSSGNVVYIPARIVDNSKTTSICEQHQNCVHNLNTGKKMTERHESPLPAAEILSNEAVRLKNFLHSATPEEIKERLEGLLFKKDPGSIHAMSKLFPGSEFTSDAAHCVRCHKDFNPNDPGRCILPHPERMVAKISQDEIGADFVCGCCNAGFRLIKMDFYEESTNAILTGHCYHGMHTTDPESVDYRIDGGAAKTCEEFGCVEFYV